MYKKKIQSKILIPTLNSTKSIYNWFIILLKVRNDFYRIYFSINFIHKVKIYIVCLLWMKNNCWLKYRIRSFIGLLTRGGDWCLSLSESNFFERIISSFGDITWMDFVPKIHSVVVDFILNLLYILNEVVSFEFASYKTSIWHLDDWIN